jgi:hypothetical protein
MRAAVLALAASAAASVACSTPAPPPKTCCEQPKIPPGVTPFVVVADESTGPSDGERVVMQVGLSQPAKRDQIYPILQTLYVYAMKRGPFEPIQFSATVYGTENAARSGGDQGVLARVARDQGELAPKCDNRVPYDFTEQSARAFAAFTGRPQEEDPKDTCHIGQKKVVARVDEKFTHRPAYKADPAGKALDLTFPFLDMGKDEYVKELKLSSAMRDWTEAVTSFFGKVDGLQVISFTGVLNDQPVMKITVSRPQFNSAISQLQETIASHANVTFAQLGMHRMNEKQAAKEQDAFQKKTYKGALALLPKNQVFVSPKLK